MATTPSTPDIAAQLKAYHDSLEYSKNTAESIREQRNLLNEVAKQAKRINIEFNKTTENIGASVKEIKMFEETEEKLKNAIRDRDIIEQELLKSLKSRASVEQQLDLARKVQDPRTNAATIAELDNQRRLIIEKVKAGFLERKQGLDQLNRIRLIKNNSAGVISQLTQTIGYQDSYISKAKINLGLENSRLDKLKMQNGFMQLGKKLLGDMGQLGSGILDIKNISWWRVTVALIEKGYENFKLFDKAAVSVRSHLGVLPGDASKLENLIKQVGIDTMHLGASFETIANSINAIADEFSGLVAQDKNLLTTTTALTKQFGVSAVTSGKFLKTLGGISDSTASSKLSMTGFAQKMATASGIPLGKIMEDVANASDEARIYIGNSAVSMIKAATAARMMGIDLSKAASSAEKLLQFESSINAELKASALLGMNINFNYARQLFFNKNIIEGNKEILRIAKQVKFNQLNPIQQKEFAIAAGKSVSELQDMLQQEKNINLVRSGTNEKAKKALVDYERMMKMKDEEAQNEGKRAEQEMIRKANQEKLIQLQNKFNQLVSELAEPAMELADAFLTIATDALPYIKPAFSVIIPIATLLGKIVQSVGTKLMVWGRAVSIAAARVGPFTKILGSIARYIGPLVKVFGTKIPVIGWIITGFLFIKNMIRDVKKIFEEGGSWGKILVKSILAIPKALIEAFLPLDFVKNLLDNLFDSNFVKGIISAAEMMLDAFISRLIAVKDWLGDWLFGNSPSKAGLLMVKGITSVADLLYKAITAPFIKGYNFIASIIPGMSEIKTSNETSVVSSNESKKEIPSEASSLNTDELIKVIQSGNQQIVAKFDQLINTMINGGIVINLDGQRVTAALALSSVRNGSLGQATTRF